MRPSDSTSLSTLLLGALAVSIPAQASTNRPPGTIARAPSGYVCSRGFFWSPRNNVCIEARDPDSWRRDLGQAVGAVTNTVESTVDGLGQTVSSLLSGLTGPASNGKGAGAAAGSSKPPTGTSCAAGHFWWSTKGLCLPEGGSHSGSPSKGKSCPKNWSWVASKGVCAPNQPSSDDGNPICELLDTIFNWNLLCCEDQSSPTGSQPSAVPSASLIAHRHNHHKRDLVGHAHGRGHHSKAKAPYQSGQPQPPYQSAHPHHGSPHHTSSDLCPLPGLTACPVLGLGSRRGLGELVKDAFECLDVLTEVVSCGGCLADKTGTDCTKLSNVRDVGCQNGACVVHSCNAGFNLLDNTCK